MITINRQSALIKWAEFGGLSPYQRTQTLCEIFWRSVLVAPLKFIGVVFLGFIVIGGAVVLPAFGLLFWIGLGEFESGFFVVPGVALILLAFGLLVGGLHMLSERTASTTSGSLLREAYRGWKEKMCPVVEIKR